MIIDIGLMPIFDISDSGKNPFDTNYLLDIDISMLIPMSNTVN